MNKPVAKKLFNNSKIANRPDKVGLGEKQGGELQLCDNCKKLGFCASMIYGTWRGALANAQPAQPIAKFTVKDYLELVPIQIEGSRFGNYSKLHLQIACDAFHQQDYETAILHFRAVLDICNFYEANISLAVAYFMVNDHENAARFADYSSDREFSILTSLKDDIIKLSIDEAVLKEQVIKEATTVETDSNSHLSALQNESMVDARFVLVVGQGSKYSR